jgi:hypothetical protein
MGIRGGLLILGVAKILGYEMDTLGAVIFVLFARTSFGGYLLRALGDVLNNFTHFSRCLSERYSRAGEKETDDSIKEARDKRQKGKYERKKNK